MSAQSGFGRRELCLRQSRLLRTSSNLPLPESANTILYGDPNGKNAFCVCFIEPPLPPRLASCSVIAAVGGNRRVTANLASARAVPLPFKSSLDKRSVGARARKASDECVKISATTVMLPDYNVQQTCELLHRFGFDGVEWRVRRLPPGQESAPPSPWGRHLTDLSPENIVARAEEVKQLSADHGLALAAFASACSATDLEQVKLLCEGAQACGCPAIRISCPRGYDGSVNYHELYAEAVEAYSKALEITCSYGVKVLVETHAGTIHPSASLAHRLVSNFDAVDIGVIYDPQNMVKDGYETTQMAIELLGDYLAHLHVGAHRPDPGLVDGKGTQHWNWSSVPMGMGLYDYPKLIQVLRSVGYEGFISIEDFGTDRSDEEKLRDGIQYLRSL